MTSWLPALEWSASTFCVITQLRTFNSCSCRTAACPALGRALLKGLLCVCAARACVRACMHACIHHMSTLTLSLRYVTPNDHAHASTRTHARTHAVTHTHTHTHTYTHIHTHTHTHTHTSRPWSATSTFVALPASLHMHTQMEAQGTFIRGARVCIRGRAGASMCVLACLRARMRDICTHTCMYICMYLYLYICLMYA